MIRSMTGFAATTIAIPLDKKTTINMTISLKSLNSRYFETTIKLPYALSNLETKFIKLFKDELQRGHIYFIINMENAPMLKGIIEPAFPVIEGYVNAIQKIKEKFAIAGTLGIEHILRLPDVFVVQEQKINEQFEQQLISIVKELIAQLQEEQIKEGAVLQKDLEKRLTRMKQEMNLIEQESNVLMEKQKIKVHEATQVLHELNEQEVTDVRKQLLYTMLDKIDIHEEIVRFNSHLTNFKYQLESESIEKGKQLDFILQELAREANTIAAKCSNASISARAITIKVELEKAREQVQNIV